MKVTMKKYLIPLLTLLIASLLGVFAFWIEMRQNGLYGWYSGVVYARWCFLVIPALFFAWLFAFCRVRVRLWKWLVFALSYAVWFALSWCLYVYLICESAGEIVADFMWPYEKIIPYFIGLLNSEKALHAFFIAFTIILVLLQYFLSIAENMLVKKLFAFTFRKIDYALLFAYPIFVIFFSTVFYLPEELISNGWHYYSFSYFCQPVHHFYKGSVIFGYMMTEGLFFLRHNFAKIEGK